MRSREKFPTKKEEKNKNPLVAFKEKEDKAMEEDKLYNSSWKHIDPEKLIDECQEVFDLYKKGDIDSLNSAFDTIVAIKAKIEKIEDKKIKDSNERFVEWIDDIVQGARSTALNKDELAK